MNIRKIKAHLKWFFTLVPVGLLGVVTAPILYPIAQLIDLITEKYNPLSWYMDDEIKNPETNADWIVYCKGKNWNLKDRYMWHAIRNTMWNLKNLLTIKSARLHGVYNREVIVEEKEDRLWKNDKPVDTHGVYIRMAELKYDAEPGEDPYQKNSGDKLSKEFSTVGTSELWYEAEGELYYRYSTVRCKSIFGNLYIVLFNMGASEKRYLLTLKLVPIEKMWD
jgi:hypothetical protein